MTKTEAIKEQMELFDLAIRMRDAQKEYFQSQDQESLVNAKQLEKEFDERADILYETMRTGLEDDKVTKHLSHLKDWVRSERAMHPEIYEEKYFTGDGDPSVKGYAFARLVKMMKLILTNN